MRHFWACFVLLFGLITFAGADGLPHGSMQRTGRPNPAPLPAAYQGPLRIDLSGQWDFRFDPDGQGEKDGWFARDLKGAWKKAAVPGSFNFEFARDPNHPNPGDTDLFYKGKAWYRTRFVGPRTRDDLFLHFSGTVLRQKVWLNGRFVGSSELPWLDVPTM